MTRHRFDVRIGIRRGRNHGGGIGTRRGFTHSFPCAPGAPDAKCSWMDEWTHEWVEEMSNDNPRQNHWLTDHAGAWFPLQRRTNWNPDSWAVWEVLRTHDSAEAKMMMRSPQRVIGGT